MNYSSKISEHIQFFTISENISIRYGIWTASKKTVGSIVLLTGRSEFLEKYRETIGKLNSRGYDVISFDWRGQGLSSRMLSNRQKGYVGDFDHYVSDLKEMMIRMIQPKAVKPIIILAHSMGGHIALRFIHDCPEMAKRAVLTAPMVDINLRPLPIGVVRLLARIMKKIGRADVYALGSGDYLPENQKYEGNKLTSDPDRFMDHVNAVKQSPELALGGVTYGWLCAAFDSIETILSPGYAETIDTPILIACAENDRIVPVKAQQKISRKLKNSTLFCVKKARHEILKESDAIQKRFWDAFDAFLDEH